ncbi:MAG: amidohydrolase family protein [Clostridia bacterium]|nr:amidohydrolase family protein [Clostridia bacterium]
MIIDFHTHIYPDAIAEKTVSFLLGKISLPDKQAFTNGTVRSLLSSMERAKVEYSVTLPVVTKPSQFESINLFAKKLNENKQIIPFGGIHPENENAEEKLEFLKSSGFKGVKLHPDYQGAFIDDEKYIRIIRTCRELGLKVIIHAGIDVGLPSPVHCPPDRALKMLREVDAESHEPFIILAHLGGWKMESEVKEKLCGKNVFFDTGYCLDKYEKSDLLDIISLHGSERILFATDSPWGSQEKYIEILDSLKISDDKKEMIFSENARKLLGI